MKAAKEILFGITLDRTYNSTDVAGKLSGLHDKGFQSYYNQEFLDQYIAAQKAKSESGLAFSWYPDNPPGHWMAENIAVASKVIDEPLTLERVQQELEREKFGYIVLSVYLNGFSTFREIAQHVRKEHPETKIIASSVGVLLDETKELVDYTIKGSQIHDLREIIGQERNDPLVPVVTPSYTETTFNGVTKKGKLALLMSSYGCMYGCDFCPATAQFGTEYVAPFSAQEIKKAIITAHDTIAPNEDQFSVSIAEPQGMGNIRLWREVLEVCRDLPFECDLITTTSSKVISKYSLDELRNGNMRVSTVNIGVESLLKGYKKNEGVNLQALNSRLQGAGINVVSTYILGLEWQTPANIKEEMKLLKELGSSGYIIANLEMQPGTPLYNQYKENGRLLDVPPELLSFYGYQAFRHPHFDTGFDQMLPLLGEVEEYLTEGVNTMKANLEVFMRRTNPSDDPARANIAQMVENFRQGLNPRVYKQEADVAKAIDQFAAGLYFNLVFKQVDLFHPFITSTN